MKNRSSLLNLGTCLFLLLCSWPVFAGDSLYGKITEVRSADVVVLNYGAGSYVVHIVGVDVPKDERIANQAKEFVSSLVLGKNARVRLASRLDNGELVCQLYTADPSAGIKDVGVELLRAGLAQRQQAEDYQLGYKYSELSVAQREARAAKRGVWTLAPPN
jgi:endonuclease YncB( thermonuclease family)